MPETETKYGERGHFILKAATAVRTEEGLFEAVISTASIDREKDIVDPEAMVRALRKWLAVDKLIPLAWNHSSKAEDQIGHIKPDSVKAVKDEVVAGGWIDQTTEVGGHAWRLVKSGTLGFSFGYMIVEAAERKGGGLHITELDVFEVTATPTPMNGDTRVLGWKSVPPEELPDAVIEALGSLNELSDDAKQELAVKAVEALGVEYPKKADETGKEPKARPVDPLQEASRQAVADIRLDGVPERKSPPKNPDPPSEPPSEAELRDQFRDVTLQLLRGT